MTDGKAKLPRKAKGQRPFFFENPEVDTLLSMLMGLAGEVSVMRDRLDTVERVAAEKGLFTAADIEAYEPNAEVIRERSDRRQEYLGEITRIVYAETEGLEAQHEQSYQQAIDLVENDASTS